MEEIQKIALEYMRNEDTKAVNFVKRKNQPNFPLQNSSSVPRNPVRKAGKFHDYTPLNASIAEIYQQVSNKGVLPRASQIRNRASVNNGEELHSSRAPKVRFTAEDYKHGSSKDDEPLVITAKLGNGVVKKILVDTGADSNILFRNAFDALGLQNHHLKPQLARFVGLADNYIKPDGAVNLLVTFGEGFEANVV
ncbi:hypothetical protein PIB30_101733 [Stylosanthes scabra]|uniref:Peptidase A2 domain-containing protein n=1 Tax=Stylosanthes scabra TaxID=79078 RepID=A0ABU6YY70_9FABA|nr:hypothetical protein [Stylosanthes scabra]